MARNGLFADDGRVNDLAVAIGRKTGEILDRISVLSDRSSSLETSRGEHSDKLNSLDLIVRALKVRDTDLETGLEGKADRTALSSLASKLSAYYNSSDIDSLLEARDSSISALTEQIMRIATKAETRYGKVVQTTGFHGLSKADRFIPATLDNSVGGVMYDTDFNGCLVLPDSGYYDIKATIYFSGGIGQVVGGAAILQPGAGRWYSSASVTAHKATGEDLTVSRSETAYLPKGTKLAPVARTPYLDGGISSWGDSNMTGTTLTVTRV